MLGPLIVQGSLSLAYVILAEAGMSFLGAGVQPPQAAWGSMLRRGVPYMEQSVWVVLVPGVAIGITVLGLNRLGDALREAFDPQVQALPTRRARRERAQGQADATTDESRSRRLTSDRSAEIAHVGTRRTSMAEPLLTVERLTVRFRTEAGIVTAVRDVTFDVGAGEVVAVVGESGSGKSVVALSVMGLHPDAAIVSGSIRFGGVDLLGDHARGCARSAGGGRDDLPGSDDGPEPAHDHRRAGGRSDPLHQSVSKGVAREQAIDLLARVGIPEPLRRSSQYPHEFSGGMCQRAMIAMAIANGPQLLIADEPTTALDVTVQAQVMEVMREIREQTGAAMLLISHDLGLVAGTAERVLVMYGGRILEAGDVATSSTGRAPVHTWPAALDPATRSRPSSSDTDHGSAAVAARDARRLPVPPRCAIAEEPCERSAPS